MLNNKSKTRKSLFCGIMLLLIVNLFASFSIYAEDCLVLDKITISNNLFCDEETCFFPGKFPEDHNICVEGEINWDRKENISLHAKGDIIFRKGANLVSSQGGIVILKPGMLPGDRDIYDNTVRFAEGVIQVEGKVKIYYNPTKGREKHKYHNPTSYRARSSATKFETHFIVNDVYDLQGITACLYGGYVLSQDIDASPTREWDNRKGFIPIKNTKDDHPFSGAFDGDGHVIRNLYINRPNEDYVGLFAHVTGANTYRSKIKNVRIERAYIKGRRCVGVVIGEAMLVHLEGIFVSDSEIYGKEDFQETAGCVLVNKHKRLGNKGVKFYDLETGKQIDKSGNSHFGICEFCVNEDDDNDGIESGQ